MSVLDIQSSTRILFGPGKVEELGDAAKELSAERVLVASDAGVIAAGHTARGLAALEAVGITTQLFDGVIENPTTKQVDEGLAIANEFRPDLIIGFGGGSAMDCAKGINFLYSCGGKMQDYWGVGKATGPMLPMIAVPTTAGTGSETQSFALISNAETRQKMACGDKRAAFRTAILDPELTLTQPPRVTALSGFDALSHAVETYVTSKRNEISCQFSREAWQHLAPNFLHVLENPDDLTARGEMQLGACFAGLAIENSMLGAAHALANPLTAANGITHGEAVALMLPHVVRFNGAQCDTWYRELLESTKNEPNCPAGGTESLADFLRYVASQAGLPAKLDGCGIHRESLPELADQAAQQWTATFNPVPVSAQEMLQLYELAW